MRPMAARGCHCTLCHGLSEEEERKGEWNSDTQVIRCCGERVFFEMEKWKRPPGWKENVSFSLYFFPCSNTIQPYIDWMVFWAALPIITHLSFKLLFYFFHFSRSCVQHIMEFAFTRCTSKRHFLNEFVSTKYWSAFIQYCTCSNPQVIAAVYKMHATFLWFSSSCTGETQQLEQHRVLIVYTLLGPTVGGRSNEKPQCERGIDWSSVGAEKGKMCFKKKKYSDKVLQQNTTFRLATRADFLSRSNLQIWSVGYFGMDMPAMSRSTVLGSCRGGRKNDRKMIPKQLTVRWFPSGPLSITY